MRPMYSDHHYSVSCSQGAAELFPPAFPVVDSPSFFQVISWQSQSLVFPTPPNGSGLNAFFPLSRRVPVFFRRHFNQLLFTDRTPPPSTGTWAVVEFLFYCDPVVICLAGFERQCFTSRPSRRAASRHFFFLFAGVPFFDTFQPARPHHCNGGLPPRAFSFPMKSAPREAGSSD